MIKHKMKLALWEAQGRACCICDKYLPEPRPSAGHAPHVATKDHVIPRSAGGGLVLLAHRKCNTEKGDRPPTERELKRIETTLAALSPLAMRDLLDGCVDRVRQAKDRAALVRMQIAEGEQALMIVLRYASTEQAARALDRLNPKGDA
jgi:hypothetical protein